MDLRLHLAMVIDLGACLGCQRCVLACRDAKAPGRGSEHLWHAHLEVRPGSGHPTGWASGRSEFGLADFGEPFGWRSSEVLEAPPGDLRPSAAPRSRLTGAVLLDRHGQLSPGALASYDAASPAFFYLPRQCNHCLAPACVESCRQGALRPRPSEGAVVADLSRCTADGACWRACPYVEATLDLFDGKSRKCDLCRDRLDEGRPPACVEVCPAARLMGPLLVDWESLPAALASSDAELAARQRALFASPEDPGIVAAARTQARITEEQSECLRRSPVFPLVRAGLALPLLAGLRTLPMVFYVPPLLPASGADTTGARRSLELLFGVEVEAAIAKLAAIRALARAESFGDQNAAELDEPLAAAGLDRAEATRLGALLRCADPSVRVVIPKPSPGATG